MVKYIGMVVCSQPNVLTPPYKEMIERQRLACCILRHHLAHLVLIIPVPKYTLQVHNMLTRQSFVHIQLVVLVKSACCFSKSLVLVFCVAITMGLKCCVTGCNSNYKRKVSDV